MFILEQDGKTTFHADGRSLLKATGHAIDNRIVMTQNGQVIGAGSDMQGVLDSMPVIKQMRDEAAMTKSLPANVDIPRLLRQNEQHIEAAQNSLRELEVLLKSMTAKTQRQSVKAGQRRWG